MRIHCQLGLLTVLWISVGTAGYTADWTQFRGPNGSGVSADKGLPGTWSDKENLKWKTPLPGRGSSSPIVLGERVYVTCFSGVDDQSGSTENLKRHLVCIDRSNGKIIWDTAIPAEQPEDPYQGMITQHGYASQTPVTDGERIYVFFGKSGVLAFDLEGKKLWQVSVGKESSQMHWGSGASPILVNDKVIVNASDESQSVRALDKNTGKEIWKAEASGLEQIYGTPTLVEVPDSGKELVVSASGELWGLDPEKGKLKWFATTNIQGQISPSVVADGDVVFAMGGRGGGVTAVRAGGKDDVTKTRILWNSRGGSNVPTPVLYEGRLYWIDDNGIARCVDAKSGTIAYEKRVEEIASTRGGFEGGPGGSRPPGSGGERKDGDANKGNAPPAGGNAQREGSNPGGARPGSGARPGGGFPQGGGGRGRGGMGGAGPAVYASVVYGDGKIFAVTRRNGTVVIAAKPEFEKIAVNKFESDDSQFNATPAISNSDLFIRSDKFLYCISVK